MNDDRKRENFKKLAEARTNKIINMIRLLGNCSNRRAYSYTDKDVKQIFYAIESELAKTKTKFSQKDDKPEPFVLK